MKIVKVHPMQVFGTVKNLLANTPVLEGWRCSHAVVEPKEDGAIVLCETCGEAYMAGAEIQKVAE